MSYHLTAYLVDLGQIRSLIGSNDGTALARLERALAKAMQLRGNKKIARVAKDAPSVLTSLRRMVRGDLEPANSPDRARHGPYNGYGLQFMCHHLGRRLPGEQFEGIHSSFLDHVAIIKPFLDAPPPFPLTHPRDFPFIHHFSARAVKREFGRLRQLDLSEDVQVAAGQLQYLSWLAEASIWKKDLIAFHA